MTAPRRHARPLTALALVGVVLAGCVTERETPNRGLHVRSRRGAASDIQAIADRTPPGGSPVVSQVPVPSLPEGPVARPATDANSVFSRVLVEVKPLGTVVFDGTVLPIVSPDGAFLAVQEGDAPSWSTLIAAQDQATPRGTRLAVYDLRESPIVRLELPDLPPGLLLGRSSDSRSFLVEEVREDGSRRIGRATWAGGSIDWLTPPNAVSFSGLLTPAGDLLYCRHALGAPKSELVLRRRDGSESVRQDPAASYELPLVTGDSRFAAALARHERGIDIEAIALSEERQGSGVSRLSATVSRRLIVDSNDPGMVYQIAAGLQGPPPMSESQRSSGESPAFLLMHPALRRMVLFDAVNAAFVPLAPDSVSAARWSSASGAGYFCTTPKDMVFTPEPPLGSQNQSTPRRRADAPVLASSLVPRATRHAERNLIVIGPVKGDPLRLSVSAVHVGSGSQ